MLVALLAFLAGGAGACGDDAGRQLVGEADVSALGARTIPRRFVAIYVDAARRYRLGPRGWSILASIHKNENGFSGSGGSPTSSAGALGPMQFIPSTWATYGADGDGDGRRDVQNVHDAIFAAAKYLRALGAPRDWRSAIFGYNHADWYVALIVDWAGRFAGGRTTRFASTAGGGGGDACTCASRGPASSGSDGPLPAGAPDLSWPSAQRSIISPFGPRWGRIHEGIDIPMPAGTALRAAAAGRVVSAGWVSGYGNYTCIAHAVRFSTCYAHQSGIGVRTGQRVGAGQRIGASGCTGSCFGPHLHFEVRLGRGLAGRAVDPAGYLRGRPGPAGSTALASAGTSACADSQLAAFDGGSLGWPISRPPRSADRLPVPGHPLAGKLAVRQRRRHRGARRDADRRRRRRHDLLGLWPGRERAGRLVALRGRAPHADAARQPGLLHPPLEARARDPPGRPRQARPAARLLGVGQRRRAPAHRLSIRQPARAVGRGRSALHGDVMSRDAPDTGRESAPDELLEAGGVGDVAGGPGGQTVEQALEVDPVHAREQLAAAEAQRARWATNRLELLDELREEQYDEGLLGRLAHSEAVLGPAEARVARLRAVVERHDLAGPAEGRRRRIEAAAERDAAAMRGRIEGREVVEPGPVELGPEL